MEQAKDFTPTHDARKVVEELTPFAEVT